MDNDVTVKIGADNEPLRQVLSDTDRVLQSWSDKILKETMVSIDADFDGINRDLDEIDKSIEKAKSKTAAWKAGKLAASFAKIAGAVGVIATVLTAIVQTTESLAKRITGYNEGLEKSLELTEKIKANKEQILEKELKGIQERSGGDAEKENAELDKRLESARLAQESAKKALDDANQAKKATVLLDEDAKARPGDAEGDNDLFGFNAPKDKNSIAGIINENSGFVGQFLDGKFNSQLEDEANEAKRVYDEAVANTKRLEAASAAARERQSTDAEKAKVKQEELNEAIAREASLREESLLRAKGDTEAADKLRSDRERADLVSQFGEAKGNELADIGDETERVNARAKAEEEAAAAKAKATEEQARNERKRETEAMRSAKALSREYERDAAKRERIAQSLQSLQDRRDEIINRRDTPIGGFESGFEQLSSRIANAASKQSGDNALEKINSEIRDKQDEANKLADMQIKKAEDVGKKVVEAIAGIQGGLL